MSYLLLSKKVLSRWRILNKARRRFNKWTVHKAMEAPPWICGGILLRLVEYESKISGFDRRGCADKRHGY